MSVKAEKTWAGPVPETCQVCKAPIKHQFADAKTVYGPWALMCMMCSITHSAGIGQIYKIRKRKAGLVGVKIRDL